MEIRSEPEMLEEDVTDLDVAFLGGQVSTLTLRSTDKFTSNQTNLIIYKGGEQICMNHRNILFYSVQKRVIRRPKPGPPTVAPVDVLDV